MKIAGSGTVAAGEYNEEIHISGSGHIAGAVKCTELKCSGSTKADGDLEVTGDMTISGSAKVDGDLKVTGDMTIAGAFSGRGDVRTGGKCTFSGAARVNGKIKADTLFCAGKMEIGGDIEAEKATMKGAVDCGGLLNAEKLEIIVENYGHAVAVGGGDIRIVWRDKNQRRCNWLPLFKRIAHPCDPFVVDESIEGDSIAVEYVKAQTVTGRVVAIGAGCEIGTVRYTEEVEISPDAKVEHVEKEG